MGDELILDGGDRELTLALLDAIDKAADQGGITWVVESYASAGKRIAAIVPADVAEGHERQIATVLATPVGTAPQCLEVPHERHSLASGEECAGWPPDHRPVNQWVEAPRCTLRGHAQHELKEIIYRPGNDGLLCWENAAPHAHWVGDRAAGNEEWARLMELLRGEDLEAAVRAGLLSRKHR